MCGGAPAPSSLHPEAAGGIRHSAGHHVLPTTLTRNHICLHKVIRVYKCSYENFAHCSVGALTLIWGGCYLVVCALYSYLAPTCSNEPNDHFVIWRIRLLFVGVGRRDLAPAPISSGELLQPSGPCQAPYFVIWTCAASRSVAPAPT
jgi:hypothetical protein